MSPIACPSPEMLFAFALGELPEPELSEVAEHLDACTRCDEQAGRLDRANDAILVGLRLMGDPGLRTLIADQEAEGSGETVAVPAASDTWGDFRIVREIGRGGMGIVYEAFQGSLNRHVALKSLYTRGDLARFRREAKAAGRLHHTNIVPVYGVGEHAGRHYYVMQFIAGRGLDDVWKERRRTAEGGGADTVAADFREVARVGLQAAAALAYAHTQGVVHRDIKPSNILLDERGTVWVTDFGLAYDSADTETLTHTGDLLGTLRYMAPERFDGRGDARADIYGLGITLYELICGRPAFTDADRAALIHRVMSQDPLPPRQVNPRVPRDLETIVLRAMAREPSRRYANAAELAEDLRRFLDDRPIRARRVGPWERGVRWCRRNRLAAGLLAGLVVVFLVGFTAVTVLWRRADAEATRARTLAVAEAESRAAEKRLRVRAQAEVAARDFDRALDLAQRGDGDLGMLWMAEALRQAPAEEPALPRLIRANEAAWEEPAPRLRAIIEHHGRIYYTRFRPDGRAVLTGSHDATARLWDTATGRPLGPPLAHGDSVFCVAFSPDGRRVLTAGHDGKIKTWDPATGRLAGPTLVHGEPIWFMTFSPDGRLLVTHGRDLAARLWDAATGQLVGPPIGAGLVSEPHFSPDSRHLLTGGNDGWVRLWDVATGRLSGPALRHDANTFTAFSPDGRCIAAGSEDGRVSVWDTATRRLIAPLPRHDFSADRVVFSPDGRLILRLRGDSPARLAESAAGRPIGPPLRPGSDWDVSSSPDRRLMATADARSARLWDVATGRPIGPHLRHRLPVKRVEFSPDGRLLLTASEDGTVKLWEIDRVEAGSAATRPDEPGDATADSLEPRRPGLEFTDARFSPDRARVILIGRRSPARLVDTGSGQPAGPPIEQRWPWIRSIAFSPDGHRIAIASRDVLRMHGGSPSSACRIWDTTTGRPVSPLLPHINYVAAVAFRPGGEVLATGDYSGAVHLWDVRTGARVGGPLDAGSIVVALAFSPDGRVLAAGTADTGFHAIAWDLESNRPIGEPIRFRGWVNRLAFSSDGTRLAAGSWDATARLVEVATGRVVGEPIRIGGKARGLAFSPDGRFLLTGGAEEDGTGTARLWEARSGRPASPTMAHPSQIAPDALAFSPDGSAFATGCEDGSVRIWDMATARPIGPPRMLRGSARAVAFGRDGRSLLAVDDRGNVRTWAFAEPAARPVERLIGRAQVRTGVELDATKDVALIDPEEWRRRRGEIADESSSDPSADADWHESCARDAESIGDGFGARWHLDRLIAARSDDCLLHARRARTWLWSGDGQAADADLARALERGPHNRIADWLSQRAADSLANARPADALRLLDRAIAARPGDWIARSIRAEALGRLGRTADREADLAVAIEKGADIPFVLRLAAERCRAGRWAEAVALYDRAIAMGTVPYEVWTEVSIAHLQVGDETGYRHVCEVMRSRHPAEIPESHVRSTLASVLTLGPGGVGEDGKGLRWIEPPPSPGGPARPQPRKYFPQAVDAVLFRAGRSAEAIERIRVEIALREGRATSEESVFLAMATFQAGDRAQARAMLRSLGDDGPEGPSSEAWWGAQARRLLRREAERLILDADFPADPFMQ